MDVGKASEEELKNRTIVKARRRAPAVPPPPVAAPADPAPTSTNPFAAVSLSAQPTQPSNPFAGVSLSAKPANPFAGVSLATTSGGFGAFPAKATPTPTTNTTNTAPTTTDTPAPPSSTPTTNNTNTTTTTSNNPWAGLGGFGAAAGTKKAGFALMASEGPMTFPNKTFADLHFTAKSANVAIVGTGADAGPGLEAKDGEKDDKRDREPKKIETLGNERASRPVMATVDVTTGEEMEETSCRADAKLFEFGDDKTWHERGVGEVKLNVNKEGGQKGASDTTERAYQYRLVMRGRTGRLLLNAAVWGGMTISLMEGGKGLTINVVNQVREGEEESVGTSLRTYALRLRSPTIRAAFVEALEVAKGKSGGAGTEEDGQKGEEEDPSPV